jgi:multimeric flavodoxin WrbA
MKITVINGNQRHGSTWNCKELFLRELSRYDDVVAKEFTLPKDLPHFCAGCFSCFFNGEQTCPHSESVLPIVEALEEADLIVLTSPVYAMDVSGPMKSLLDHLCFMWMSHRPNPRMFRKVGLIITTTAGAGSSHARKTLKNSMRFWGVNRIFSFNPSVSAMKWDDVEPQKKAKLERLIKKQSVRIERAVKSAGQAPWNPVSAVLFRLMRSMMRKNTWNPYDRSHWERNGWL